MTADDGRKNSSESSCYAYIYCYFFTCLPSCINLSNIYMTFNTIFSFRPDETYLKVETIVVC